MTLALTVCLKVMNFYYSKLTLEITQDYWIKINLIVQDSKLLIIKI